jgi:hypothetical protein
METNRLRMAMVLGSALVTSWGCSGSTLSLQLTDAPPDLGTLSAALVTISAVDVHLAGVKEDKDAIPSSNDESDGSWKTLDRPGETFDLLRLQNDVVASLGEFDLPEGKITQIRLHLDRNGVNEIHLASGQVCPLDLTNVAAEGVKINQPFKALDLRDGHTTHVVVDFDLKESVSQDAPCVFRLAPVIKLKSSKMD